MTATAVFELTIPDAGVAAAFTGGEKALAVASPISSTTAGTFYLARLINLKAGTYTLKLFGADVVSAWLGTDMITLRRIATTAAGATAPIEVEFYTPGGVQRLDLILVNIGAGSAYVALSIRSGSTVVYASSADGWRFDTAAIPDGDLPATTDARLTLPVFSLTPNWAAGITERLSWNTEIFTSESATEQRRSLLRNPRRSFEASFLRQMTARMRLDNFFVGVSAGEFVVPLWHEQHKLRAQVVGTTVQFPAGTLRYREFYAGELAMFQGADPAVYEVVVVQSADVVNDTITLASSVNWPAGSRITPARVAEFTEMPSMALVTDRVASVQARFDLRHTEKNIIPDWGYCAPLWMFSVDRAQPLDVSYERMVYRMDNGTAPAEVYDASEQTRVSTKVGLRLFGRERLFAFRSFLAEARGRAVRFWAPSFSHDVEPVGTIGGITLDTAPTGFFEFMQKPQDARVTLGFTFNDGRPSLYREIVNVEMAGPYERLTLATELPPVSRASIARVQFIVPSRFDQDTFEIHHVTDSGKAAMASAVLRSAEIDGMPPIECQVTSWTYPVVFNDAVGVALSVLGGSFGMPPQLLSMGSSMTITGGSFPLTVAYRAIDDGAEHMGSSMTITGGSFPLVVGYRAFDNGIEHMGSSLAVTGGSLAAVLIRNNIPVESIGMTLTITGGTLT